MLAAECAQVQHAPVGRAEKRAGDREASRISAVRLAHPHDAAEIVDVVGAAGPSAEGSQVDDAGPLGPQKRVAASAHDLPSVVDSQRDAGSCSQGTEIPHAIGRRPEERVRPAGARLREAHDRALVVHVVRDADRKSTRLNSSHSQISYAVFCLKKKKSQHSPPPTTSLIHNLHLHVEPTIFHISLYRVSIPLRLLPYISYAYYIYLTASSH